MTDIKSHEDIEHVIKQMITDSLKATRLDHDPDDSTASYRAKMQRDLQQEDDGDGSNKHH